MPPKKLVECAVIILDCSTNVSERIKYLYKLTSVKYFKKSKDDNKILFFNNGGSCATEIIRDWNDYDIDKLPALRDEVVELKASYSPTHVLNSLETAIQCFDDDEDFVKNNFKRIILISDFKSATESCDSSILAEQISQIQFKLSKSKIWLHIIGPEVKVPKLYTVEDVANFSKNIEPAEHLAQHEKFVIKQFSQLFQSSNEGVMCDYETGFELLFSYVQKQLTSYPYYVNLNIGTTIQIPVLISRLTRDTPKIKLNMCFLDDEGNTDKGWFEKKSHERVTSENVVPGFEFHKKRVILTADEEQSLRDDSSLKCLSIIAFVNSDEIRKELYFMSHNLNVILPDPRKSIGCQRDLCAFLEALRRKNVVAIAKRVYNNKFRAWPFAIFSCSEHEKCLLMGKLPFKHEFNEKYVAGKEIKIEKEIDDEQQCLYKFLDHMSAKDDDFCDQGKVLHPLAEHLRQNMNRLFKFEYLGLKCVDIPTEKTRELKVNSILLDRSEDLAEKLLLHYVDDENEEDD